MTDWTYLLFAGAMYVLGFLGLLAITLLPLRAFLALRRNSYLWHASTIGKAALLVVAVAAISAIWLSIPNFAKVFRCLTEMSCGPNRASGWFFLAFMGAFYLGFELLSNAALLIARRATRVAV